MTDIERARFVAKQLTPNSAYLGEAIWLLRSMADELERLRALQKPPRKFNIQQKELVGWGYLR